MTQDFARAAFLIFLSFFFSKPSLAGIARILVLGSQPVFFNNPTSDSKISVNTVNGSLWYDDSTNVFFNPAAINDHKNYVVFERDLEGGIFASIPGYLNFGLYMNRGGLGSNKAESNYAPGLIAPGLDMRSEFVDQSFSLLSDTDTRLPVELFLGSDFGVKWGAHLAWAQKSSSSSTSRYWHFDLGAQILGIEPFLGFTFAAKSEPKSGFNVSPGTGTQSLDEFNAGLKLRYESWSPYFVFHKAREAGNPVQATGEIQTVMNVFGLGTGHDIEIIDGYHFLQHAGVFYNHGTDDTATTADERSIDSLVLPLTLAFEGDALTWLTVRAGFTVDAVNTTWLKSQNVSRSLLPTARIGGTAKYQGASLDVALGTQKTANRNAFFAWATASYAW